jgi:NADH:ubiquinone oxidoreductase subunit C
MNADEFIGKVKEALGKNVLDYTVGRRNRIFVKVKNGHHKRVVKMIKEMGGHLSVISSVDLGEELELVYHFEVKPLEIGLKTAASKVNPKIETISDVYPSAAWYEREAMEMMGITIVNHPDPRHLFLPDDYQEFPLRRF